jgi:putative acetyltransferase
VLTAARPDACFARQKQLAMLAETNAPASKHPMSISTTIRHVDSAEDLGAVRILFRQYQAYLTDIFGEEHISLPEYEREIASLPGRYSSPRGQLLLARVNNVPAGCAALYPLPPAEHMPPDKNVCEMKRLFVLPYYRGFKLGRRLSDELIAYARNHGYDAMYLDTVPDALPQASALYAALGFLPVSRYNDNATTGVKHFRLALRA